MAKDSYGRSKSNVHFKKAFEKKWKPSMKSWSKINRVEGQELRTSWELYQLRRRNSPTV